MEHLFDTGMCDWLGPRPVPRRRLVRRFGGRLRGAVLPALLGLLLMAAAGITSGGAASPAQHVTVRAGDTLWSVARSHYPGADVQDRVAAIERANHLGGARLSPGQELILPVP
jgi:hypothetical protein